VLKACYSLFISVCLLCQACAHVEEHEQQNFKKPDLSKAASYNVQLGLGYLRQGDRSRAKKKLLTALEQEPKSPDVNSAMAYYFEQTHEVNQAEKYYLKALSLASHKGAQLNNYGAFLCRQGNYQKADRYFLNAAKDLHYIHTAGAYENAGLCALSASNTAKARLYFMKALNQDPSRNVSFYELIKIEVQKGNHAKAYSLLRQYPDLVLNDKMLLSLAKEIAINAGQYKAAVAYEHDIKNIDPNLGAKNEYNNHA
jgi:type IV pilus assembly protein PilF